MRKILFGALAALGVVAIMAQTPGSSSISLSNISAIATHTILANLTGSTASPTAATPGALSAILCAENRQVFTSGTTATYTTPTCNGVLPARLQIRMCGPGAGGAGSGTTPGTVSAPSTDTLWSSPSLDGGAGGIPSTDTGGSGGTATGGDINIPGGAGMSTLALTTQIGGTGGSSGFGGPGGNGAGGGVVAGNNAPANSGGGGQGASDGGTANPGGGGGGGGCVEKDIIGSIAATYTYSVGQGTAGGTLGTNGAAGGNGANGWLDVKAYWQ